MGTKFIGDRSVSVGLQRAISASSQHPTLSTLEAGISKHCGYQACDLQM